MLFDTNVLIDVLLDRAPFADAAAVRALTVSSPRALLTPSAWYPGGGAAAGLTLTRRQDHGGSRDDQCHEDCRETDDPADEPRLHFSHRRLEFGRPPSEVGLRG